MRDKLIGASLLPASHPTPDPHTTWEWGEAVIHHLSSDISTFPAKGKNSFALLAFLSCSDPLVRLNSIASHFIFVKHISWFQMNAYSCPEKFLEAWQT